MKKILFLFLLCLLSFVGKTQSEAHKYLEQASILYYQGNYKECIEQAEEAVHLYGLIGDTSSFKLGEAYFFQGSALDNLKKQVAAEFPLRKALQVFKQYPETPDTMLCMLHFSLATAISGPELRRYKEGIPHYEKALEYLPKDSTLHWHIFKSKILSNLGSSYTGMYRLEEAIFCVQQSLKIRKAYLPEQHELIAKSFNQLGNIKNNLGQWGEAIDYYKAGLEIFEKVKPKGDFYIGALHHNLANIIRNQGKMQEARDFYEIARRIFEDKLGLDHYYTLSNLAAIGFCNYQLGNLEEAEKLDLITLDRLIKKYGEEHEEVAIHLFDIASSLSDWSTDQDKVMEFFERAVSIAEKIPMSDPIASGYINYSQNIAADKRGTELVEKALAFLAKSNPTVTQVLMPDYYGAALYYERVKSYGLGLVYTHKIIDFAGEQMWELENFGAMPRPVFTFYALIEEGIIYHELYKKEDDLIYLDSAAIALDRGLKLYEFLVQQYSEETSQLFLQRDGRKLFEQLFVNQLLRNQSLKQIKDFEPLFELAERARANILLQSVYEADASAFANVPSDIVAKERTFKEKILYYEKEHFSQNNLGEAGDSAYLEEIKSKLLTLRQEKNNLESELRSQYPLFYALRNLPEVASLKTVQENLVSNQALLEYFVGDSSIYVLVVQNETTNFYTLPLDFDLNGQIQELRDDVRNWSLNATATDYPQIAFLLYQKLMQPLGDLPEDLIIITDNVLSYLPFELLIKKSALKNLDFRRLDYLLNHHSISYNASASLWLKMREKEVGNHRWLGFAPTFESVDKPITNIIALRQNLGPLLFNQPEVEGIVTITNGEVLTTSKATKASFLEKAQEFGCLHIASHAKMNDKNPNFSFLAFAPETNDVDSGRLFVNEIYNQELPAEMVVLSACETGIGKFREGEGLLSLSRAFIYAGAKSLITSLWSVNDKATADIMTDFYQKLNQGFTKDQALRQSKRTYLSNCLTSESAHPFFWAGFIATGDMKPIDFQPNRMFLYLFSILGLIGIFFLLKKIKKW